MPWQNKGDLRRILCESKYEGKCEGRRFTLTLTLTTETTINRALQKESEGVRVKKEKKFFLF